ncbi:MAG: polyribonucleotide nucleotidyltransferase [Candidatus Aminicenantes bacterium]|nr:polyribonucleotide nucleotidyltransferase [Acidobacteriota bacterium]MBU4404479.1 polyribonucleotide nucleotidyltransferase [Acidobacteriota bacterium]MCG2810693.1 polyribonucleotide nucleotidyltransferase [Candidatus Aminicenantes bacterium]
MQKTIQIEIDGSTLKIDIHRWAQQSNGSALLTYKDNMVLVTANMREEAKAAQDFLPLMVDFRENTYSAGKIPGGFFKREGRPSEKEVLLSRLIDRPIRPLFADNYNHDTQVIAMLLSADFSIDYDSMGIIGASAALISSTIPFSTPLGAVKIGWKNNEYFINPGQDVLKELEIVLQVAGTEQEVVMLEAAGNEFSDDVFMEGLRRAKEVIAKICQAQKELLNPDKMVVASKPEAAALVDDIRGKFTAQIRDAIFTQDRVLRRLKIKAIHEEIMQGKEEEGEIARIKGAFEKVEAQIFRQTLLQGKKRTDNRAFDEIRAISIELGILPRVHGSAVFTRGETQSLSTVTLGSEDDAQRLDNLNGDETKKKFLLHYNFPPFSVGEVSFLRGAGRREIGHGNLAEKSLSKVIPDSDNFPYTIRVVSDILESNGSSSMATVCGATLALMNAGVPIKAPVAGIAMGLVKEGDQFAVLTDIAGYEDHFGDMDFKVAGTEKGITAIQLDIKIKGLTDEIIRRTIEDARKAYLFILAKMKSVIAVPSEKLSEYAPVILTMMIPVDKIRDLIGPGGKNIKELVATYSVKINAEDDGKVSIAAANRELGEKVIARIEAMTGSPEVNKIYNGKINRIEDYGLFVEIMPGVTGLLHVSEISNHRIRDVRQEYKLGQMIEVKVLALDRDNKMKLSHKVLENQPRDGEN